MKKQFLYLIILFAIACSNNQKRSSELIPDYSNINIYEVNIRQYTPEGTFKAFQEHLPRLKEMGVKMLWLMPVNPISNKNKKGELGSYYAVSDYKKVNPEFGTEEDFRNLVNKAKELGFYFIIDWVPNHTGWDHIWLKEHKDYYTQDKDGNVVDPIDPETGKSWGWTDVADLNYDNQEMRKEMLECLKYWINNFNIDGIRFDVAHNVPLDFWVNTLAELKKIKPNLYFLAESEVSDHLNKAGFNSCYGWEFHHIMNAIAKGNKDVSAIDNYLENNRKKFEKGDLMYFTSNHDENSWSGTEFERMGDGHKAFAVLSYTFDGVPLIYCGQEEPLMKRLKFFEKDDIGFKNYSYSFFYKTLQDLKTHNKAIWNYDIGGKLERINTTEDKKIFAFNRTKDNQSVIGIFNLSKSSVAFELSSNKNDGKYKNVFSDGKEYELNKANKIELKPWEYLLLEK